jgi:alkanesulfonate monooxygenase SsuD/methylene tetrahydromethanopterin reductase-like flavin-dependent oxidoreductase (luciferase family)
MAPNIRHAMLAEAVEIISALFEGGYMNYRGQHFEIDSAKLWDLPDPAPPSASPCRARGRAPWRESTRT